MHYIGRVPYRTHTYNTWGRVAALAPDPFPICSM